MAYIGNAPAAGIVNSGNILDGSINTADLADAAVTAQKLAAAAITDKLGYTPVNKAGDTVSGFLLGPGMSSGSHSQNIALTANPSNGSAGVAIIEWGKDVAVWGGDIHYLTDSRGAGGNHIFWKWDGSNYVQLATVSKNGGVRFPSAQISNSDANTLDDYEEGTYTPTVVVSSGVPTYQYQQGYYTKIGRQVFGGGIIGITNSNQLGGSIRVSVPFVIRADNYGYTGGFCSDGQGFSWPVTIASASFYSISLQASPGASSLEFIGVGASAGGVTYTSGGVAANWYFRFSFSYYTD